MTDRIDRRHEERRRQKFLEQQQASRVVFLSSQAIEEQEARDQSTREEVKPEQETRDKSALELEHWAKEQELGHNAKLPQNIDALFKKDLYIVTNPSGFNHFSSQTTQKANEVNNQVKEKISEKSREAKETKDSEATDFDDKIQEIMCNGNQRELSSHEPKIVNKAQEVAKLKCADILIRDYRVPIADSSIDASQELNFLKLMPTIPKEIYYVDGLLHRKLQEKDNKFLISLNKEVLYKDLDKSVIFFAKHASQINSDREEDLITFKHRLEDVIKLKEFQDSNKNIVVFMPYFLNKKDWLYLKIVISKENKEINISSFGTENSLSTDFYTLHTEFQTILQASVFFDYGYNYKIQEHTTFHNAKLTESITPQTSPQDKDLVEESVNLIETSDTYNIDNILTPVLLAAIQNMPAVHLPKITLDASKSFSIMDQEADQIITNYQDSATKIKNALFDFKSFEDSASHLISLSLQPMFKYFNDLINGNYQSSVGQYYATAYDSIISGKFFYQLISYNIAYQFAINQQFGIYNSMMLSKIGADIDLNALINLDFSLYATTEYNVVMQKYLAKNLVANYLNVLFFHENELDMTQQVVSYLMPVLVELSSSIAYQGAYHLDHILNPNGDRPDFDCYF